MIRLSEIKLDIEHTDGELTGAICRRLRCRESDIADYEIIRRSIDARKKPELFYVYTVDIEAKDERALYARSLSDKRNRGKVSIIKRERYIFPDAKPLKEHKRPVIAGFGPAGMFAAYYLSLGGLRPLVLERGRCVEERRRDVDRFWEEGVLDPESNVLFGEGGAGTFSDGKLNTLVKDKEHRGRAVLELFVRFGASESILYDHKPHIGTDVLYDVVRNIRDEIIRLGGEICFKTKLSGIEYDGEGLRGVRIETADGEEKYIETDRLILATGHSARDTYHKLFDEGLIMEAKPFAVGFRVEHPQRLINIAQYGSPTAADILGSAPYKLTAHTSSGRGVYTFCMCPGGYVVNSSSEEGGLCVNGMSYSKRNGANANAAVIVTVTPKDYPDDTPLSGIEFQRDMERKAYELAKGKIPIQRYGDFKKAAGYEAGEDSEDIRDGELSPQDKGAAEWCDLSDILPAECNGAFIEGMESFGRQIKGFNAPNVILSGVESRTSSPVRIPRDESMQASIKGIYPCGEGAGYAGGIMSAAMDGIKAAEAVCRAYNGEEQGKS